MDSVSAKRLARTLATPITLVVLLVFLAWGARWGYRNATSPPAPPPVVTCSPTAVGKTLKSEMVQVNIYNGGRTHGLGRKVSSMMKARGFQVKHVDNTEERVDHTIIVGASKNDPAVKLVAQQFVKPEIREDQVPDGVVDVLVGNKFAGWTKTAKPWQIQISEAPCLPPPSQSPSESMPASVAPSR